MAEELSPKELLEEALRRSAQAEGAPVPSLPKFLPNDTTPQVSSPAAPEFSDSESSPANDTQVSLLRQILESMRELVERLPESDEDRGLELPDPQQQTGDRPTASVGLSDQPPAERQASNETQTSLLRQIANSLEKLSGQVAAPPAVQQPRLSEPERPGPPASPPAAPEPRNDAPVPSQPQPAGTDRGARPDFAPRSRQVETDNATAAMTESLQTLIHQLQEASRAQLAALQSVAAGLQQAAEVNRKMMGQISSLSGQIEITRNELAMLLSRTERTRAQHGGWF